MTGIDQERDALSRARNRLVNLLGMLISSAALYVAVQQVIGHGIQDGLRSLRAGRVIEKDKAVLNGWKRSANSLHREIGHGQIIYVIRVSSDHSGASPVG